MSESIHKVKHAGKTLVIGDTYIYYELRGSSSGIPLFILHGGPGFDHSYLELSPVWNLLKDSRPVIFYDQRGCGRSAPLAAGQACGLAEQLADLHALQQHLGFEQIDLLGHSWGGFLAMAYSARHPGQVRKLILVASAAPKINETVFLFKDVFPEVTDSRKSLDFRSELGDRDAIQADIRLYLSLLFYSESNRDAFLAASNEIIYRPEVNKILWSDAERFDLQPELPKFRLPVLIIAGRFDMNVATVVAYKIHTSIPGSKLVVFEKSGHMPALEEPDKFFETVNQFLSENQPVE